MEKYQAASDEVFRARCLIAKGGRAELAKQFHPAIRLRTPHGLFEQRQRLEAIGDVLWPVGDLADCGV